MKKALQGMNIESHDNPEEKATITRQFEFLSSYGNISLQKQMQPLVDLLD